MKPFRSLSQAEVLARLSAARRPAVLIHASPDGDCVGTGAALCRALTATGRPAVLLSPDPVPPRLAFLCEGVRVVDALPDEVDMTVAADVASPAQLGRLAPLLGGRGAPALMIDHHRIGTPFADHLIDSDAAACGEIVWRLIRAAGDVLPPPYDREMLNALYAAILSDTGCFRYSNTTPATLRAAAELMEHGADADDVVRHLFFSKTPGQIKAEALAATAARTSPDGRIRWLVLPYATLTGDGHIPDDFESAIEILREEKGVEVTLVAKGTKDGRTKCSLRSSGADVAAICASFGGGGHTRAAGCTINEPDAAAAAQTVLREIEKRLYGQNG